MAEKSFWKRVTGSGLLLPVMSLLLVMAVNIVFDILSGNNPFNFFMITLQQTTSNGSVLYGRIIDISDSYIEVTFDSDDKKKKPSRKFMFPSAFFQGLLQIG